MDRGCARSRCTIAAIGVGRRGAWRGGLSSRACRRASGNRRRWRRHRRRIRCGVGEGRRRIIIIRRRRIVAPRARNRRPPAAILVLAFVLAVAMLVLAFLMLIVVVIDKQCPGRLRYQRHAQALRHRGAAKPDPAEPNPDRHSRGQRCPDHLCCLSQSSGTKRDNAPSRHPFALPAWLACDDSLELVTQPSVPAMKKLCVSRQGHGQYAIIGRYPLRRVRRSPPSSPVSRSSGRTSQDRRRGADRVPSYPAVGPRTQIRRTGCQPWDPKQTSPPDPIEPNRPEY